MRCAAKSGRTRRLISSKGVRPLACEPTCPAEDRTLSAIPRKKLGGGADWPPPPQFASSLLINEMATPVLLPAGLVLFGAEWLLLSVAAGLDGAGTDFTGGQCILHRRSALIAEGQVVFGRNTAGVVF